MLVRFTAVAVSISLVALFAASPSSAKPPEAPIEEEAPVAASAADDAPFIAPAARLLAEARRLRESEGCARAAPTYRVVAGMGEGEEAAQHELGECLLTIAGVDATETELFRQEGVFWLSRAAYAGNARAQRALALHFAPQAMGAAANADALKWALVYAKNPDSKVYGYKELPPTFVPGLESQLGQDAARKAQSFAASFKPLTLARFEPPKPKKGALARRGPGGDGPPRGRPR